MFKCGGIYSHLLQVFHGINANLYVYYVLYVYGGDAIGLLLQGVFLIGASHAPKDSSFACIFAVSTWLW